MTSAGIGGVPAVRGLAGAPLFATLFLVVAGDLSGQLPRRQPVEVFRLGGIDAPDHSAFTREPGLVADAEGALWIRQSRPPRITLFDPHGGFVHSVGREGEGPGELTLASRHGLLADTLWVIDRATHRITYFATDGALLGTDRLAPLDRGPRFPGPQVMTAPILGGHAIQRPDSPPVGAERPIEVPVLFGSRELDDPSEVATVVEPRGLLVPKVGVFWLEGIPALPPFLAVASSGIGWLTVTDPETADGAVLVERFDHEGAPLWSREVASPRVPVSGATRRALHERGVEMLSPRILEQARGLAAARGLPGPRGSREELVAEALHLPAYHAPVDRAVLGRDGSAWLRRGGEGEAADWVVLDAEGVPSFEVSLPRRTSPREATLGTVWVTVSDELEVPYVVRLDLR